jgi:hypothetical protein
MNTATAIERSLISPNVADANLEPANVVDVVHQLARATHAVALAITPNASPGKDVNGGHVESLTEAAMGVSQSLQNIADAVSDLAQAVRDHGGAA